MQEGPDHAIGAGFLKVIFEVDEKSDQASASRNHPFEGDVECDSDAEEEKQGSSDEERGVSAAHEDDCDAKQRPVTQQRRFRSQHTFTLNRRTPFVSTRNILDALRELMLSPDAPTVQGIVRLLEQPDTVRRIFWDSFLAFFSERLAEESIDVLRLCDCFPSLRDQADIKKVAGWLHAAGSLERQTQLDVSRNLCVCTCLYTCACVHVHVFSEIRTILGRCGSSCMLLRRFISNSRCLR